uniref:Sulfotransferase n=1 Tax=Phallusia mammillata TaxID=59560 RepID=A0A6F9DE26_9ASCI|nr:heparan sulfate glucosamine 3-O-sulfotransferase 1-like [Phallusia mammillata]
MSHAFLLKLRRYYKLLFVIVFVILLLVIRMWYVQQQFLQGFKNRLRARDNMIEEIKDYNDKNVQNLQHRLPKVIGIGVKKCGTDGVLSFLNHHPLVRIPDGMESFFFTQTGELDLGKYRRMMPLTNERQVAMEKTPIYFAFPPGNNPERIKSSIPGVKLILIVCDPTPRAFSDYVHERARYKLFRDQMVAKYNTFEQFVDGNLPILQSNIKDWLSSSQHHSDLREKFLQMSINDSKATLLSNGIYSAHIQQWQRLFNETTLKIVDGNKFMDDPGSIIEELQDFIGIPKVLLREDFVRHPITKYFCYRKFTEQDFASINTEHNHEEEFVKQLKCLTNTKGRTRNGKQKAKEETLEKLRAFYYPFNQQFFKDIGENFSWSQPKNL